jgi:uncharacterized membrane protein
MQLPTLIPNLHPFIVHFSVALLLSSTVFLLAGRLFAAHAWAATLVHAGRWNLYLAAAFAITSIGTGWFAFLDARVDAQALQTAILHRRTGAIAWWLSLFAAIGVWRTRQRMPGWIVLTTLIVASCSITMSALYGSQLVYRHGLGIERPREEPRMPVAQLPVER